MSTLLMVIRLLILFLIVYAFIKNIKTLIKAALIIFLILILLGLLGY